ncbi:MAG: CpsB/CapC family capsule biosynthesis tyrosine phosphatase [Anaerolineae bacterium]
MIDLHSHILPGLDDGARTQDESVTMAREWVAAGVTTVACTPHSEPHIPKSSLAVAVARLQSALDAAGIALRLALGIEVFLEPDMASLIEREVAFTLGGTRYMLVELPFEIWPPYTEQTLFALQVRGVTPILAHPERYRAVQLHPERVAPLVERGVLMQLTAYSLTGRGGREIQKAAGALLRHGHAHLIASDSHRPGQPSNLPGARAAAAKIVGEAGARALVEDNPAAILADVEPGDIVAPTAQPGRRWPFG